MWLRTFFMVRQWGRAQARTSPLACSLRWHLCACNSRTSCCWISLRFSGSAVGPAEGTATPPPPASGNIAACCCGCCMGEKDKIEISVLWMSEIKSWCIVTNNKKSQNKVHTWDKCSYIVKFSCFEFGVTWTQMQPLLQLPLESNVTLLITWF